VLTVAAADAHAAVAQTARGTATSHRHQRGLRRGGGAVCSRSGEILFMCIAFPHLGVANRSGLWFMAASVPASGGGRITRRG
jgi:hypothetical protein